jgi:hypothetical protein
MGKATLAHQRAIGEIGAARAQKLTEAGLTVLFTADYERLRAELADAKRRLSLLRDVTVGHADDVAAMVLREAMGR